MRSYLQWTVHHLGRCLQSSATVCCFRCQGFLSGDGTLGLHDCFKQHSCRRHASRPQGGKAVGTLCVSYFVMHIHLKGSPARSVLMLYVCDLYKLILKVFFFFLLFFLSNERTQWNVYVFQPSTVHTRSFGLNEMTIAFKGKKTLKVENPQKTNIWLSSICSFLNYSMVSSLAKFKSQPFKIVPSKCKIFLKNIWCLNCKECYDTRSNSCVKVPFGQ